MQRTRLIIVVCTLLVAPSFVSAAPTPGCGDPIPGEYLAGSVERWRGPVLEVSDGLTYRIDGSSWDQSWPDSTGQWDWIEPYFADVCLTNAPGTSWYSSSDTNVSFASTPYCC